MAKASEPSARLTLVTLGVAELARATRFYEQLGFERKAKTTDGVAFFDAGGIMLAVFPWQELAKDAQLPSTLPPQGFRGVSLAWNCGSPQEVDAAIARAVAAGARVLKAPQQVFWGGYAGYFSDLDGHAWEVAFNPHFPLDASGKLQLPD